MTFTSPWFALFLPIVYLAFRWSKEAFRRPLLLAASYVFYAGLGEPVLPVALLYVTLVSYFFGLRLRSSQVDSRRFHLLWSGIIACLLALLPLKYWSHLAALFSGAATAASFPVTIGVSYFTFQAIAYLADVYLEIIEPETHLGHHALALAFFPKLLQGPIERAGDLLPQLKAPFQADDHNLRSGLLLFGFGLMQKLVVADRLAVFANQAFDANPANTGLPLWLGIYAYTFQIYFDFAGYTDMARGIARLFGIRLSINFNRPYLATSIPEFWRRWHMTFSRWIFDYLFKPLQMIWRDWGSAGTLAALSVTFLVSGVWHGAAWGFVVWGLLHGAFMGAATVWQPWQKKLRKRLGLAKSRGLAVWDVFCTFHLVAFSWIFFRAATIGDAVRMIRGLFDFSVPADQWDRFGSAAFLRESVLLGQNPWSAAFCLVLLLGMALVGQIRPGLRFFEQPFWFRWVSYYGLVLFILFFGLLQESTFLYFRF